MTSEFNVKVVGESSPRQLDDPIKWIVTDTVSMTIKPVPRWKQKLNSFLIFWGFKKMTPERKTYPEIGDYLPVVPEATKVQMPMTFEEELIKELTR